MSKLIKNAIKDLWHVFVGCAIVYFLYHIYKGYVVNELRFLLPAAIGVWILEIGYDVYKLSRN